MERDICCFIHGCDHRLAKREICSSSRIAVAGLYGVADETKMIKPKQVAINVKWTVRRWSTKSFDQCVGAIGVTCCFKGVLSFGQSTTEIPEAVPKYCAGYYPGLWNAKICLHGGDSVEPEENGCRWFHAIHAISLRDPDRLTREGIR